MEIGLSEMEIDRLDFAAGQQNVKRTVVPTLMVFVIISGQ